VVGKTTGAAVRRNSCI